MFAAASTMKVVDKVTLDLGLVRRTVQQTPALKEALVQRVAPDEAKKRIMERLFAAHVDMLTLHFLYLLVEKRREEVIDSIEDAFKAIADSARGIVRADVVSAVDLTDAELTTARSILQRLTGKTIEITKRTDPYILGGLVIRIGDKVIDGSIRGQLQQIRKALAGVS